MKLLLFSCLFISVKSIKTQISFVKEKDEDLKWKKGKNRPDFGDSGSCSFNCRCEPSNWPVTVTCENLNLIPQDLPPSIKTLNLKYNNKILQISSGTLSHYTQLQALFLSHNKISSLNANTFRKTLNLRPKNSFNFKRIITFKCILVHGS